MIVTFPMLVSQAVSENTIPGIAKTLEIFLIIHNMDSIIQDPEIARTFKGTTPSVDSLKGVREDFELFDEGIKDQVDPGNKRKNNKDDEDDEDDGYRGNFRNSSGRNNPRYDEREEEKLRLMKDKQDLEIRKWEQQKKDNERKLKAEQDKIDAQKRKDEELYKQKEREFNMALARAHREQRKEKATEMEAKAREEKAKADEAFRKSVEKNRNDREDLKMKYQQAQDALKRKDKEDEIAREKESERKKEKERFMTTKVDLSDYKTISLEPTYMKLEIKDKKEILSTHIIGIKVLPYRVKSEIRLSKLIMNDIHLSWLAAKVTGLGRKALRLAYSFIDKWIGRLPSKDPRKDVVFNRTGFGGKGFILLSKSEDIDKDVLNNVKSINRLFKLGWGNIIITDDIKREAHFCMAKYKGICNTISYAMMYDNLKKLPVYDSLEDIRKQQSSLFKIKKNLTTLIGEWVSEQKQENYTLLKEDYKNERN